MTRDEKKLILIFFAFAVVALTYVYGFGFPYGAPPIRSDGFGYNAYLPALLIDHDLTFVTLVGRLSASTELLARDVNLWSGIMPYRDSGRFLDIYPIGTAALQLPFFFLADCVARLIGLMRITSTTTYPPIYQVANVASSTFYFLIGLLFTFRSLRSLYDRRTTWITIILMTFGTSLFHYATLDGSFSHVYSFALCGLYVWLTLQYAKEPKQSVAAAIGAVIGLMIITRNQNGVLGLIAVGAGLQAIWSKPQHLFWIDVALASGSAFLIVAPQLLYWHYITGDYIINSYDVTPWAFQWGNPEITKFLFSVRKGAFFWGPGLLIAFVGFLLLERRLWVYGAGALLSVAIEIYICASWASWWFGGSFGSRPIVDFIPVLAIPAAATISVITRWNARASIGLVGAIIIWTSVLMHSYWIGFVCFDGTTVSDLRLLPEKYLALWNTGRRAGLTCVPYG